MTRRLFLSSVFASKEDFKEDKEYIQDKRVSVRRSRNSSVIVTIVIRKEKRSGGGGRRERERGGESRPVFFEF